MIVNAVLRGYAGYYNTNDEWVESNEDINVDVPAHGYHGTVDKRFILDKCNGKQKIKEMEQGFYVGVRLQKEFIV